MIWELICGIFFMLLSIAILVFSINLQRRRIAVGYIPYVGVIAVSDIHKGQIIVDYTVDGKSYSAPFDCDIYARVGEMPPAGLRVKVIVDPDVPDQISNVEFSRQWGRGNSGGHKYVDYDKKKDVFAVVCGVIICFLFGIDYIFQAFGWI